MSHFAQKSEPKHLIHILISVFLPFFPEPSVMMFKNSTQSFSTSDPTYTIPVVRTRNTDSPATVKWRTKKAQRFDLSGPLKFNPGELEKNIVIDPNAHPSPIKPESFQLELFDPSSNASVGERKTTTVNVTNGKTRGDCCWGGRACCPMTNEGWGVGCWNPTPSSPSLSIFVVICVL